MSRLTPFPRPLSRLSNAESDTTFYSTHETALAATDRYGSAGQTNAWEQDVSVLYSASTLRQDSGYESLTSKTSQGPRRRTTGTTSGSLTAERLRSASRRSARSRPSTSSGRERPLMLERHLSSYSYHPGQHQSTQTGLPVLHLFPQEQPEESEPAYTTSPSPAPPLRHELPPATTHYWTSDQTRRLEYAAIDAASRGVKAWMLKHMVPDCFVPRGSRHNGFDDDRGSVRRYRLDLGEDESVKGDAATQVSVRRRDSSRSFFGHH
jgi:hypothetical protein